MTRSQIALFLKYADAPHQLVDYFWNKFGDGDTNLVDAEDFKSILDSIRNWQEENIQPAIFPKI